MQCWGLLEANEQKWRIQHCTGGVGALCKHPYAKCPNSFDDDCRYLSDDELQRDHLQQLFKREQGTGKKFNDEETEAIKRLTVPNLSLTVQ